MKIVKIDSCNVCPFCRPNDNACMRHYPIEKRETVFPIPNWCPLEEIEDVEDNRIEAKTG